MFYWKCSWAKIEFLVGLCQFKSDFLREKKSKWIISFFFSHFSEVESFTWPCFISFKPVWLNNFLLQNICASTLDIYANLAELSYCCQIIAFCILFHSVITLLLDDTFQFVQPCELTCIFSWLKQPCLIGSILKSHQSASEGWITHPACA